MKLDLHFREFYPHPIAAVWAALTDSVALGAWLMTNDFVPRVGHRFTFREQPKPAWRGWIECEVLVLEPPTRMVWSWRHSADSPLTQVAIQLKAVAGGTELTLEHTGETDPERRSRYASGWPGKLAGLRDQLLRAPSMRA